LAAALPPPWLAARAEVRTGTAAELATHYAGDRDGLPRADVAVADAPAQVDAAIRPFPGREQALVRPRGCVLWHHAAAPGTSPLLAAIASRGLALTSSRCGDFRTALDLLAHDTELQRIGARLVTHRFPASALAAAFATARSRGCIKAVVEHGEALA
jgi:threonine dehydrogenase-like Zn-dependent dehydrogenase